MIVDSAKVQAAMLERELGTMQLTELSGLPSKTISNFVNCDRPARVPTIVKLAAALNMKPTELIKAAVGRGNLS